MATIRSYTTIEQSRKLAEILPIESADMWWLYIAAHGKYIAMMHEEPDPHYIARMESYGIKDAAIRCWSLAALLDIIPKKINFGYENYSTFDLKPLENGKYLADYYDVSCVKDNPIDACYEVIIRLNELNLL